MDQKLLHKLAAWFVFVVSLSIYILTLEQTLSLWDCGEFLVSASKLEINHSPGSPLFMLIGRVFSLFSFGNATQIAFTINLVSAFASAATILFLFLTIIWLIDKIEKKQPSSFPLLLKYGSATIGALSYAFTDSFWFSAVEAEVYALSSMFSAAILWAATRWEQEADQKESASWILLIFFLTGLSIGVHLLNLLVIPSACLIFYFRKFKFSVKGTVFAILISGAGIVFLLKIFIPGILELSKTLELFFVNRLNFPINSGLISYLILLSAAISFGLFKSHKKQLFNLNLGLLCLVFILVGYSTYVATVVRATSNVPINQGNPSSTFSLLNYLNREQYGSRPILFGENYGSIVNSVEERNTWIAVNGKYIKSRLIPHIKYDSRTIGFFPRMHSSEPEHMSAYKNWVKVRGQNITIANTDGEVKKTIVPTFIDNFSFFMRFQFGYMYLRYFMWNFIGRQNDIQGIGDPIKGNWQSGFTFIDKFVSGSQDNLPSELKENKARNSYFFLPLLLGIAGLLFHFQSDRRNFLVVVLLFFMMSLALVVYLNEVPNTPRERDYVYVGSFYVFCIWIGLGVLKVFYELSKIMNQRNAQLFALGICCLASPILILYQNYDDHDRSGRVSARDLARNYLESCEKNSILFTHADNDTYPLWYCQEVEGIRRDVRIVVMPYLQADWYIAQLQRKFYKNNALKMRIPLQKYQSGELDYIWVVPKLEKEQELKMVLDFVGSDEKGTKLKLENGDEIGFIPVRNVMIEVNGRQNIHLKFDQKALNIGDLAFWDIISSNWDQRPICFTSWVDPQNYGLNSNLIFDGLIYRLTDHANDCNSVSDLGEIESEELFEKLMIRCNWDSLSEKNVYFDWHHRRMLASMQIRNAFYRLAKHLTDENKQEKALQVINKAEQTVGLDLLSVDYQSIWMAALYEKNNQKSLGVKKFKILADSLEEWLDYYRGFSSDDALPDDYEYKLALYHELVIQAEGTLSSGEMVRIKERLGNYLKGLL